MPTRTKSVEMNKIVTNSEMHLHHCPCESRGFNWKKCSIKHLFPSPTQGFSYQFYKIFENSFFTEHFRATAFDE